MTQPPSSYPPAPSAPPPEPGLAQRPRKSPLRRGLQYTAGGFTVVVGLLSLTLPSPYLLESPGPTFNTTGEIEDWPVIELSGAETFETEGTLALTTVYVNGQPTSTVRVPSTVLGWFAPTVDLTPHELVYPSGTTAEQVQEANSEAMASSHELALAAALDYLGEDFVVELSVIDFTAEAADAGTAELLALNDLVLAADGEEVTGLEGLRQAVNDAEGDPIELTVLRDDERVDIEVPTYQEADGEFYVGVLLASEFEFPIEADISLEGVGGPSAGLMFTLGLIDTMTEEQLTGGEHWAGTGTVDPDGTVGAIGGAPQKVAGALNDGAEHFLVPRENCDELEGRLPSGIDVYGVEEVSDAVEIVEAVRDGDEDFLAGIEACGR